MAASTITPGAERNKLCIGSVTFGLDGRRKYVGPVDVAIRWKLDVTECVMAMSESEARRIFPNGLPAGMAIYRVDPTGKYEAPRASS